MSEPTQTLTLPIEGMTCSSCISHVQQALAGLPGVSDVVVNLATAKASLTYHANQAGLADMQRAVADAGYHVPVAEVTLEVRGMTCASCVDHVEKALTGLRGVEQAAVNLGMGTARLRYIPGVATVGAMKRAVRDVGYEAQERSAGAEALDRERQARQEEVRRQGRNLLVAGTIGLLIMIGTFYDMLGPLKVVVPVWLSYKWVLGLLTTPIVFGPGRQFFIRSWRGLKHGVTDMNLLYATGIGAGKSVV